MNLDALAGLMTGQDCLVVGSGPSAWRVRPSVYEAHWTIACGKSCVWCKPDFEGEGVA